MIYKDVIIIGGGPAGLCAALHLLENGLHVLLVDRNEQLGGQLIKQTHKFFGSEKQYAHIRGIDIAKKLIEQIKGYPNLEVMLEATVVGLYQDKVATILQNEKYIKVQSQVIIVATGASEKFLAFENNDLPGIYGAGAVQTLMNLYGVLPGKRILMVGSGNIGLIVSYQLIQAGAQVVALVEAASSIGGYKVHASKLKRLGVDILTSTTIKRALGSEFVEAVEIVSLNENWEPIAGSEKILDVDAICIAVGLNPMHQLLSMINVETKYVAELGGFVAVVDDNHQTSVEGVYVCGDVGGIEEASSAIVEGYLVGLIASKNLGIIHPQYEKLFDDYHHQLHTLRSGPFGVKTNIGLAKLREKTNAK